MIDGDVALLACDHDTVLTSDAEDIRALLRERGPRAAVTAC